MCFFAVFYLETDDSLFLLLDSTSLGFHEHIVYISDSGSHLCVQNEESFPCTDNWKRF